MIDEHSDLPASSAPSALAASVARLKHEAPLAVAVDARLTAAPSVRTSGPDPVTEAALALAGLADAGLVARRLRLEKGIRCSLLGVPTPLWHDGVSRPRLIPLKRAARAKGTRLVLVPEEAVRREPVLTTALLIAACAAVPMSATERLVLTQGLAEEGGAADLASCACWLSHHPDPIGAVLRLVGERRLRLDLTRALDAVSLVHLVQG